MQIEKIVPFSTPLWKFNIGADFGAEVAACYELQERLPTVIKSNIGGYQSPSIKLEETFPALHAKLVPVLATIANNAQLNINIDIAWVNINKTYNGNQAHDHRNCALSGVVYLQVGADTGPIVFENPTLSTFFPIDDSISPFFGLYSILPAIGDVVVFPAYLKHFVRQNLAAEDRISIAFNMV